MKSFSPSRAGSICQLCPRQAARRPQVASSSIIGRVSQTHRSISSSLPVKRFRNKAPNTHVQQTPRRWQATATTVPPQPAPGAGEVPREELTTLDTHLQELANAVLQHPGVPAEETVLRALKEYQDTARTLLAKKEVAPKQPAQTTDKTATSALLSSVKKHSNDPLVTKQHVLANISMRALDMVLHAPVFITPNILKSYVELQVLLQRPQSFPQVFDLYRSKPVPRPTQSKPITYDNSNPDKPAAAVAPAVADMAIDAAIAHRDMPLALATIESTYCTTAYKRSKVLRSALFPFAGLALTPPLAYTLATRFSDWQTTMDPQMATQIAMAAILTYTTAVATVGYVALTTANDQMVRITWASGMPLWERWVREEERGAFDKIAQAWGFTSRDKWGEEEGEEWEGLNEFTGLRGMVLDRVELMDGME